MIEAVEAQLYFTAGGTDLFDVGVYLHSVIFSISKGIGVDYAEMDTFGRNALHYAVIRWPM